MIASLVFILIAQQLWIKFNVNMHCLFYLFSACNERALRTKKLQISFQSLFSFLLGIKLINFFPEVVLGFVLHVVACCEIEARCTVK